MYPFMTLEDDTEITHSEMRSDGRVKVYFLKKEDSKMPQIFRMGEYWIYFWSNQILLLA